MGDLNRFFKQNKIKKENIKIPATVSLLDKDGNPLEWEIRPMTTAEDNALREECTKEVQVTGKPGLYRPKFNGSQYLVKMAAACIIFPNLNDKELQDSYGVMGAEKLLLEMLDDPGEFNEFMNRIQEYHGFKSFQDKVETAKN